MRKQAVEPPTLSGRVTKHYDMITHTADDEGALNLELSDTLERQRKSRFQLRHVVDNMQRMKDVQMEDIATNQRHENVAHERWEEVTSRGHNIITNRAFGDGPKFQKLYEPFTVPRLTTWETVEQDRSGLTPPQSGGSRGGNLGATPERSDRASASAPRRGSLRDGGSHRSDRGNAPTPPGGGSDGGAAQHSDRGLGSSLRGGAHTDMASQRSRNASDVTALPGDVAAPRSARQSGETAARRRPTPRTLSEAGSASLGSARGRPPPLSMSGKMVSQPPPPPPIPGSPVGSVYSRPKM